MFNTSIMATQQELMTELYPSKNSLKPPVIVKHVCMECGTFYDSFSTLRSHIFHCHYCRGCELFFEEEYQFESHMYTHYNKTKCPYCPTKHTFKDGDDLTSHITAAHPEEQMDICCAYLSCSYKATGLMPHLMEHYTMHLEQRARDYAFKERQPISDDPVEFWVGIKENTGGRFSNSPKLKVWMQQYSEMMVKRLEKYRHEKQEIDKFRNERRAKEQEMEEARQRRLRETEQKYKELRKRRWDEEKDIPEEEDFRSYTSHLHDSCPCYACSN